MQEHVQIVFFFKERNIFDPIKISYVFSENYPNLKQPIIFPVNISGDHSNDDIPAIIYNQFEGMQLIITFYKIIITIPYKIWEKEEKKILDKFFNTSIQINFDFSRMGYILNLLINDEQLLRFKNMVFKKEEILKSNDFSVAWLQKINFNDINVNLWKSYNSDSTNTTDGFISYDFNTLLEDNHNINLQFAKNFIQRANKYITHSEEIR